MTVTMTAGQPLRPEHFLAHAAQIEAIRMRIVLIRITGHQIGRSPAVFGRHSGSFPDALHARYARQDELMARLQENLMRAVGGMRRVATGKAQLAQLAAADSTSPGGEHATSGEPSAGEVTDDLLGHIARREWVDGWLSHSAAIAAPARAGSYDSTLRATAVNAATAGIDALRQLLEDVTGTPPVITHRANCWSAMSQELYGVSDDLRRCLERDFTGRDHPGVHAYVTIMADNVWSLRAAGAAASALAVAITAAGDLIVLTRDTIRGLVGELCTDVIVRSADAQPVAVRTLAARIAETVWRIHTYVNALTVSLTNLSACLGGDDVDEQ
ncbi:hypothetical protein OWR29_39125 [Actinoplanes sp. Pm04-4]|uniref:Uncharacterized protein n=1 Tax=Paractinoplanes pyxinae TaxID=2997416 RepID=A0ABT4BBZ5_9ACTN|nr:hypothetical protein [Actinoplanes pyxinae]MCY1144044.1 hypothetical protein [Actinoplanes pyxinae]